ncbi:MAG: hypothetical protein WCI67_06975 [Chloroflexales bacterium]
MHLPTPVYRHARHLRSAIRAAHRWWRSRRNHATRRRTWPTPSLRIVLLVLLVLLTVSLLANLLFVSIFLIAAYG